MVAGVFHFVPRLLQLLDGFLFFLPGNHDRVVGNPWTRPFGGIKDVDLKIPQLDIHLFDAASLGLEFPFVTLTAKKTYLRDHPDVVQRFIRAYTEAIALYKNNRELAIKVTQKYTGIKDPAILSSTVNFYAPKLSRAPYPTVGSIRFVLEQIAAQNPKAKNANPETFMDVTFVKQLEESGFIQGLYAGR